MINNLHQRNVILLEATVELLSDRSRWTKGAHARDVDGEECAFDDPRATSWCLVGALFKANGGSLTEPVWWQWPSNYRGANHLEDFNDGGTHESVLLGLRRALTYARARAAKA